MNNIQKILRAPALVRKARFQQNIRSASHQPAHSHGAPAIRYVNENDYTVPSRPPTLNDHMVPYGSFQQAQEAERKLANKMVVRGIIVFMAGCTFIYNTGLFDAVWMPNLDNIMQDTEPVVYDKEGRITV